MNIYLKSFLFLAVFSLLHFGYEITGWSFLAPFCSVNESVFQHLKMAFWSYLLITVLVEYPLLKRYNKKDFIINNFWYSRFLSAIIIPYIILVIWYLLPALFGKTKSLFVDLIWALAVTFFSCIFTGYLEKEIEKIKFKILTKYIILFLVLISGFLFVKFTYKLPWIDLFIEQKMIKLK
jgi:hypothetical protein